MIGCGQPASPPPLAAAPSSCKPDAPIQVTARLIGDPHAGSTCGVIVSFTALADGDVSIQVALPTGVGLVRGDTTWTSPLRRGERRDLKLDVSIPDTLRREIVAYGTIAVGGARCTTATSLVLNESGAAPASRGVEKRNSRGESILEFKAE